MCVRACVCVLACMCVCVGMMDYEGTTEILVFTPLISQRSVDVTIFNDNIVEGQEYFTGSINGTFGLVIARPDISYVTIDEDINDRESSTFKNSYQRERFSYLPYLVCILLVKSCLFLPAK